ncbi:MAG: hypothetical protein JOZ24_11145 [Candidatus Eremiobacteraeota bacterium]|nr:hypothetical protein [Candidatus Eremiobacteraeota bacterium]
MALLAGVLILVAAFLTIGVGANVASLHTSDAAGDGLAEGFAMVFAIALWLSLGILLLVCAAADGFRDLSGAAMLIAFFVAVAGQVRALGILMSSQRRGVAGTALRLVTIAAPLLVIARAIWGTFSPVRASIPEPAGSWSTILLLALISLVPFAFPRAGVADRRSA